VQRDKQLVQLFVGGYNGVMSSSYEIRSWPDVVERTAQAVEAIAVDDAGARLAIEHTLLQPFVKERDDSQRFLAAIAPLEKDTALVQEKWDIDVITAVGAVPTGVKWEEVFQNVRAWLRNNLELLPPGVSTHRVEGLPFDLFISIQKTYVPDSSGSFFVMRHLPPDTLDEVMRIAFSRKIPKLTSTKAERRVLLLEKADIVNSYARIREVIEKVGPEFSEFSNLDEIWLVDTVAWETENVLFFYELWPTLKGRKFRFSPASEVRS